MRARGASGAFASSAPHHRRHRTTRAQATDDGQMLPCAPVPSAVAFFRPGAPPESLTAPLHVVYSKWTTPTMEHAECSERPGRPARIALAAQRQWQPDLLRRLLWCERSNQGPAEAKNSVLPARRRTKPDGPPCWAAPSCLPHGAPPAQSLPATCTAPSAACRMRGRQHPRGPRRGGRGRQECRVVEREHIEGYNGRTHAESPARSTL